MKNFVGISIIALIATMLVGFATYVAVNEIMLRQYCRAQNANFTKIDGQNFCIDIKKKTVTKINWVE